MICFSSKTIAVFEVNGYLAVNFNIHWKLYFQSNDVENPVQIKHILVTLCCWEKCSLIYVQLHNNFHYTFHYNKLITQEFSVSTYTSPSIRTLSIVRIRFSTDPKFKIIITVSFGTMPQSQSTFIFSDTVFYFENHASHMSISSFSHEPL